MIAWLPDYSDASELTMICSHVGDIVQSRATTGGNLFGCMPCERSTYLLEKEALQCKPCPPQGVTCFGGQAVSSWPGYYTSINENYTLSAVKVEPTESQFQACKPSLPALHADDTRWLQYLMYARHKAGVLLALCQLAPRSPLEGPESSCQTQHDQPSEGQAMQQRLHRRR